MYACALATLCVVSVVALIVLLLTLDRQSCRKREGFSSDVVASAESAIPSVIWSYWDGDIPHIVHACMDSWRRHNPHYKIILLTKDNLASHTTFKFGALRHANESPARFSDFVRLQILSEHGGFWIDASIICNAPLTWVHEARQRENAELVGYYNATFTTQRWFQRSKVIESWFLACIPNSRFVRDWRDEFLRINNYATVDGYLDAVRKRGTDLQNIEGPNYLAIHVSAQVIMQQQPPHSLSKGAYRLYLQACEDTAFKFLADYDTCARNIKDGYNTGTQCYWDVYKGVAALHSGMYHDQPIIKLRSCDRQAITDTYPTSDLGVFFR